MPPATPDMTMARHFRQSSSRVAVIADGDLADAAFDHGDRAAEQLSGQDFAAGQFLALDLAHIAEQRRDFFRHGADDAEGVRSFSMIGSNPNGGSRSVHLLKATGVTLEPVLLWLRRDLRIGDNPALAAAVKPAGRSFRS